MPVLKQTIYLEFEIEPTYLDEEKKNPNPAAFQSLGTAFPRNMNLSFVPDYMRVKQITHFSTASEYDLNIYYVRSNALPDDKIFAVAVGNVTANPDLYFPIGRALNSSFDFTIQSKGNGDHMRGLIILALEFTKELGYHKPH